MRFSKRYQGEFVEQVKGFLSYEERIAKSILFANAAALLGTFYFLIFFSRHYEIFQNSFFIVVAAGVVILLVLSIGTLLVAARMRKEVPNFEKKVEIDPLTGALNRQVFEEALDDEIRRASRYHYALTICRINLDDFRSFNKSFGQDRSDDLLCDFARLLEGTVRMADCVARYEKDEFCVLLPHTDLVRSEKFISRLLEITTHQLDCTFSAGLTPHRSGESRTQFMMRAQTALAHAKQEGKKKVCCVIGKDDSQAFVQF